MTTAHDWDNLSKRLQKAAQDAKFKGLSVVTVRIIVVDGQLRAWSEPSITSYEPKGDKDDLTVLLTG